MYTTFYFFVHHTEGNPSSKSTTTLKTRLSFEIGINFFLKNGTYIYLKRLTCMNEDVLLHVGELGEGFATNFTLKMFHHIV